MNTIIAPSLLSCDFTNLSEQLQAFSDIKNLWFHLDIMDGHFVPNLTFGATVLKNVHKYTKHPLDAHFMVTNPEEYIESFSKINLHNFTFHLEAVSNPLTLIAELKKYFPSVGISIKPKTDLSLLTDEILKAVDLVLVMSVEPGFGGQSYITGSENKVFELTKKRKRLTTQFNIQVDGGVNKETSQILRDLGADILVSGSYIFKSSNYDLSIKSLRS